MNGRQQRYFIELKPDHPAPETMPRNTELEMRRETATQFITMLAERLKDEDLEDKVSILAVTALGQVLITCEADVINLIRDQDDADIAEIRHGSLLTNHLSRWMEAH